jgi:hypothetical protein
MLSCATATKAGTSGDTPICASSNFIIPLFKCGNLSSKYADLNFKFVIVQVLFIDKDG